MVEDSGDAMQQNRSSLKDFLGSLITMTGDLTNISAPPFVLDIKSTVEVPSLWAENPSVFCAPATSEDPAERAMLALRTFICGLRSQCYLGHSAEDGLKKPLNAFLGELFIAKWEDDCGTTQVVSEQVSHHPPVTACKIWNDKYGVSAESYNQPLITFTGSVHIESAGLVLKSLTKHDEHYLIPIPDFKVTSLLSTPSPELTGTYYIPSTSGYMSVIHFSEKGFFGGSEKKHSFEAQVFKEDEGEEKPRYTMKGSWYDEFTITDATNQREIATVNVKSQIIDDAPRMIVAPLDEQDSWETRKAWRKLQTSLKAGDMKMVSESKNMLEEGQRQMRRQEESDGREWKPLFFDERQRNPIVEQLIARIPTKDARKSVSQAGSGWTLNMDRWKGTKKPYHGSLRPDNTTQTIDDKNDTSAPPSSTNTKPPNTTQALSEAQDPASQQSAYRSEGQPQTQFADGIDHKIGAAEDPNHTPTITDGLSIDIGQTPVKQHIQNITHDEPGPQTAQVLSKEAYQGSGIEGMSLREKQDIEDMLRDQYSTAPDQKKDYISRKRRQ